MRWPLGRRPAPEPAPAPEPPAPPPTPEPPFPTVKFVGSLPSDRNAVDIFGDRWVEPFGTADVAGELRAQAACDIRPPQALAQFGTGGRLDGMNVLELGPLEGCHTCMLESYGASVTSIEGNVEAYLKCLVAKDILGLRSRLRLGSFEVLLDEEPTRYDLIFASGVLYHMSDPLRLIERMAARTDRVYLWTHFHDPNEESHRTPEPATHAGVSVTYHRAMNAGREENPRWWGGLDPFASWMERDDIIRAFREFGFGTVDVLAEAQATERSPPQLTLACRR